MKDKVLWILTYLDCVNRYAAKVTYFTRITRTLNTYCNDHRCNTCAMSLKDLICLSVFIKDLYDELNKQ